MRPRGCCSGCRVGCRPECGPLRSFAGFQSLPTHAAWAVGDGRRLVALWQQYGPRLRDRHEAWAIAVAAEQWRERIQAAEAFLRTLGPAASERSIRDAWQRLADCGGHPSAEPQRS